MNLEDIFNYLSNQNNRTNCLVRLYDYFKNGMYDIDFNELIETGNISYENINIELFPVEKGKNGGIISYLTKNKDLYSIGVRDDTTKEKIIDCTLFYLVYIDLINLIENKKNSKLTNHDYVLSFLAPRYNNCDYSNFVENDIDLKEKLINTHRKLLETNNRLANKEYRIMYPYIHSFVNNIKNEYTLDKVKSRN